MAKKVIIVEDEKPLANALNLKLQSTGFETEVAHNGEEALEKLAKATYDLMLIDVMMPKKDGFSVIEELRAKNNTMPIFVMSNLSQPEDVDRMKTLKVEKYIIKSDVPLPEIVKMIEEFFAHYER